MNRRRILIGAIIVVLVLLLLFVTRCSGTTSSQTDTTAYKLSKTITLAMSPVTTLNPVCSKDEDTFYIDKLIYSSLFTFDDNMTPEEDLAGNYEFNSSSVTIKLRRAKFSDGRPVTAHDVKFSIRALKMMGSSSEYSYISDKISYASVINKRTVKIYFNSGTDMSLSMLTFPVLPSHRYNDIYSLYNKETNFKPVGSGQYKVKSYDNSRKLVLVPNDEYYGDAAENTITFSVTPYKQKAYQLLESSNISMLYLKDPARKTFFTKSGIKEINFPSNEVEYLGFNFKKTDMQNAYFRKAIASSINCKRIIQQCYSNSGIVNDSVYYPNYMGENSKRAACPHSIDKADSYMKKAEFTDANHDGYYEDANGSNISLTLLVNSDDTNRSNAADIVASELNGLGINVIESKLPESSYLSALKNGNFDIYIGGMQYDDTMDMREILYSNQETNYTGYTNTKLDTLLDKMQSGLTQKEMTQTFNKIHTILQDDLPYYCLLYKTYGAMESPSLKGTPTPLYDNYYRGLGQCQSKFITKNKSTSQDTTVTQSSSSN